jgi:hypothetical protein
MIVLGFYPGGTRGVIEDMAWGFLTVSLSDAEPTWQGWREGGPRRAEGSRDVEGKGTKSKGANQVVGELTRYSDCGTR